MMSGARMVMMETHFHRVPGASFFIAPYVFDLERLPIMLSERKIGRERNTDDRM